jgi:hypothetical protein
MRFPAVDTLTTFDFAPLSVLKTLAAFNFAALPSSVEFTTLPVLKVAPMMPSVPAIAAAPAKTPAPTIAAPVKSGALPSIVIPTVSPPLPKELHTLRKIDTACCKPYSIRSGKWACRSWCVKQRTGCNQRSRSREGKNHLAHCILQLFYLIATHK